jgi:signal transduction histidine kinase
VSEISADRQRGSDTAASRDLRSQARALARQSLAGCAGTAFVGTWRSRQRNGLVGWPAGSRWQGALGALLAEVERRLEAAGPDAPMHLEPAQLVSILAGAIAPDQRFDAVALRHAAGFTQATAIIVAPHGAPLSQVEAILRLAADRLLEIIDAHDRASMQAFWRRRAFAANGKLNQATSRLDQILAERRRLDNATAAASRLHSRNRFAELGAIAASLGPFEAWIVAIADNEGVRVAAASATLAPLAALDTESAIAESLRRKSLIVRTPNSKRSVYHEDRVFARFPSYVCLPFTQGAFALAATEPLDAVVLARVKAFSARIDPLVRSWLTEIEASRLTRLVRSLGLRMFSAIDIERARIARDLHDHQAQLLAAARIGIEAGPDQARIVFKRVEDQLRAHVRELRPASLGRSTLVQALRQELRRFANTPIKGRLLHAERMGKIPRPVQQLCYQITREAVSNVLRHSAATHVEIAVERRDGYAMLTIHDDGKGINRHSGDGNGMGLAGLAERLELIGGRLRIDSRPGSTRLIAEIPQES